MFAYCVRTYVHTLYLTMNSCNRAFIYVTMATPYSHTHMYTCSTQRIIAIPIDVNTCKLKDSLGEVKPLASPRTLNSPHLNCPLPFTYLGSRSHNWLLYTGKDLACLASRKMAAGEVSLIQRCSQLTGRGGVGGGRGGRIQEFHCTALLHSNFKGVKGYGSWIQHRWITSML